MQLMQSIVWTSLDFEFESFLNTSYLLRTFVSIIVQSSLGMKNDENMFSQRLILFTWQKQQSYWYIFRQRFLFVEKKICLSQSKVSNILVSLQLQKRVCLQFENVLTVCVSR